MRARSKARSKESVGERIQRLRRERELTQRDLARRVEALNRGRNVTFAYLSRIESGQRDPSVRSLRMLAEVLGVSAHYLEFGVELNCKHCGQPVTEDEHGNPP